MPGLPRAAVTLLFAGKLDSTAPGGQVGGGISRSSAIVAFLRAVRP